MFFRFLFCLLSPLVWFFLWLPEEVLALLFLLHRENGDFSILMKDIIYTHCWELMNSVGSHGSSSLPFVMKVMVCHFVSDSHEVMTALIVVLPIIVVVEISLQLRQAFF